MSKFNISLHAAVHAGDRAAPDEVTFTNGFKKLATVNTSKTNADEIRAIAKKLGDDYAEKHPKKSFTISISSIGDEPPYHVYNVIRDLKLNWIKNVPDWAK